MNSSTISEILTAADTHLPLKIQPCPIHEAIIEIRFDSLLPDEAVFGTVFNRLKTLYPETKRLGILDIPESIRNADPNLRIKPHYQLHNPYYIVQIGSHVLSLVTKQPYPGWDKFYESLQQLISIIKELKFIDKIFRLGIRYSNFFEFDISNKINLGILIKESRLVSFPFYMNTSFQMDKFSTVLQITNQANLLIDTQSKNGSLIDVDVFREDITLDNLLESIEKGHRLEKQIFFNLLSKEFLNELNPEY